MKIMKFVNINYKTFEWSESESVSALLVSSLLTPYSVEFGVMKPSRTIANEVKQSMALKYTSETVAFQSFLAVS